MINRELTEREKEMLEMIRPTTFQDIVSIVRKDVEQSKYDAKRELRNLRNDVTRGITNEVSNGATNGAIGETNGRDRINHTGGELCEAVI